MKAPPRFIMDLCNAGALIVGSYAAYLCGKTKNFNDYDLIVPSDCWSNVAHYFPETVTLNSYGGVRFNCKDKTIWYSIDIWPSTVEDYLRYCNNPETTIVVDVVDEKVFTAYKIKVT